MAEEEPASGPKIEIRLAAEDLRYFDALRGEISRKRFATILLLWAMDHPEEAFRVHFEDVRKTFHRKVPVSTQG